MPARLGNPKPAASHPDHPRTVQIPEHLLDRFAGLFFATRFFGPDRAALNQAQLPATDAAAAADHDTQQNAVKARIARIETSQDSKILELEGLPADRNDSGKPGLPRPAPRPVRRTARGTRTLEAQLKALAKTAPQAADSALLDRLPLAGDILPGLSPRLKAGLFSVFDVSTFWNTPGRQVTVRAELTETTLQHLATLLDPARTASTTPALTRTNPQGFWATPQKPQVANFTDSLLGYRGKGWCEWGKRGAGGPTGQRAW